MIMLEVIEYYIILTVYFFFLTLFPAFLSSICIDKLISRISDKKYRHVTETRLEKIFYKVFKFRIYDSAGVFLWVVSMIIAVITLMILIAGFCNNKPITILNIMTEVSTWLTNLINPYVIIIPVLYLAIEPVLKSIFKAFDKFYSTVKSIK